MGHPATQEPTIYVREQGRCLQPARTVEEFWQRLVELGGGT